MGREYNGSEMLFTWAAMGVESAPRSTCRPIWGEKQGTVDRLLFPGIDKDQGKEVKKRMAPRNGPSTLGSHSHTVGGDSSS